MDRDDRIMDYMQNRLSPAERAQFEQSMAEEPALAAEVELMRAVRMDLENGPVHKKADAVWDRLSSAMEAAPLPANDNRSPWRQVLQYAAVALVAVMGWHFAIVPQITDQPGGFEAASEQSVLPALQIRFVNTATLGDITALLTSLDGRITDGPSALGLVQVSFPDAQLMQEALALLRSRPELVELVQEQ